MAKRRKKLITADLVVGSPILGRPRMVANWTARMVEELHKRLEAGEDWALLDAVDFCARAGMAMPEWLVDAFCDRYMAWRLFKVTTLDQAFKVRRKKGTHIGKAARREALKPRVVLEVLRQRRKDKSLAIDEELFRRVGKKLKISGGQANRIYYAADNHWRKLLSQIVTADTKI